MTFRDDISAPRRHGAQPAHLISLILLVILAAILLAGCGASQRALPPLPTRTPWPTFTPTPPSAPQGAGAPTATPERIAAAAAMSAPSSPEPQPTPTMPAYSSPWASEVPKTGRAILIDQDQQYMYIFEDGIEVRAIPVSTGDPTIYPTKAWEGVVGDYVGTFFSFGSYADYAWYLFDDAGRIMLHGAPYLLDEHGGRIYLDLEALGRYPVSHGCIRMHPDEARWLTFWNPRGVPIIITPLQGTAPIAEARG